MLVVRLLVNYLCQYSDRDVALLEKTVCDV